MNEITRPPSGYRIESSRTDNLCKRCPRSRGPCNDRLPPARETTNYFKLPTWPDDKDHV